MSLAALFVLCRFVHFMAVMLMFGVSVFTAILSSDRFALTLQQRLQPLLASSTLVAAFSAVGLLSIQAGIMGDGWADTYQFPVWGLVLGTRFGQVWQWHLALSFISILLLFFNRKSYFSALMVACSSLLLASLAFIGHAAMHDGIIGWIHQSNQILHLFSAGYWFGSLLPLLVCLPYTRNSQHKPAAIHTLIRFSSWGHLAVVLVVVTGMINSFIILRGWPLDFTSTYQRLLWCKIVLVVLMIIIAVINRYRVVPAIRHLPEKAHYWLVMNAWFEVVLGAAVLLLVSTFATFEPV
ncbi:copper resistance protein CopD [Yersinia entomophaga]|uniref:Copper resistance protein D n=1 Tax=Yersinia entomophaga TaxID=935293 RepID=A0ABN4Q335_YERET|nr:MULTISPECIES: copper homeostasis membrane protein CopD [Yersinia]ANI31844.1 copper resistance protein CopD [Yersinia entomophaga]OWF84782.1 copper resistance protein CopD [Yersinia entomophaga]